MLFSSYTFLFLFLPATLLLYFPLPWLLGRFPFFTPGRILYLRNLILFFVSLVFYSWGEPRGIFLMLFVIFFNFLLARLMAGRRERTRFRLFFTALSLNLLVLFYFKYAGALLSALKTGFRAPALPLGISFYTFQAISYLCDVKNGKTEPARDPLLFGTYLALFPQLIAGPIVRYTDVNAALTDRRHTLSGAAAGARRFTVGLAKKVLLSNPMGELFRLLSATKTGALGSLMMLLSFAFQIYFDFSGYSDMAIGLGRIFGFSFPENFRYPYISKSISEFWRRWHITLSSFFKEYVYIPLGGNRRGRARTYLNLFMVWALTGLWHGAALHFLLWGIWFFLLLVLEKSLPAGWHEKIPAGLLRTLTFCLILLGWMFFAFDGSSPFLTLAALPSFFVSLFGARGFMAVNEGYHFLRCLPLLMLAFVGSTPLPRRLSRFFSRKKARRLVRVVGVFLLFFLSVAYLSDSGFQPFLYFRF